MDNYRGILYGALTPTAYTTTVTGTNYSTSFTFISALGNSITGAFVNGTGMKINSGGRNIVKMESWVRYSLGTAHDGSAAIRGHGAKSSSAWMAFVKEMSNSTTQSGPQAWKSGTTGSSSNVAPLDVNFVNANTACTEFFMHTISYRPSRDTNLWFVEAEASALGSTFAYQKAFFRYTSQGSGVVPMAYVSNLSAPASSSTFEGNIVIWEADNRSNPAIIA